MNTRTTKSTVIQSLIILALAIPLQLYSGFTIQCLWDWYIVPIFHVSHIGVVAALGLALFVSFMTGQLDMYAFDRKAVDQLADTWKVNIYLILRYTYFLIAGWVIHFFV